MSEKRLIGNLVVFFERELLVQATLALCKCVLNRFRFFSLLARIGSGKVGEFEIVPINSNLMHEFDTLTCETEWIRQNYDFLFNFSAALAQVCLPFCNVIGPVIAKSKSTDYCKSEKQSFFALRSKPAGGLDFSDFVEFSQQIRYSFSRRSRFESLGGFRYGRFKFSNLIRSSINSMKMVRNLYSNIQWNYQ